MLWRVAHLVVLVALGVVASTSAAAADPRVFRGPGIVLRTPSGWYVTNAPLNGITNPVQRFVLSSYRVPTGRPDFDGNYAPPPRGVVVQLLEEMPPLNNGGVWPQRPLRFRLPRLGLMEGFGGDRWGEVRFREHGRRFYIFLGIGRHASSARIGLSLESLDGMTITARH
jgi:hypothetical protein